VLKGRVQAHRKIARWSNGVSGEEAAKVNNVEAVIEIVGVGLKAHADVFAVT
jgi:hypothetical protein